MRFIEIAGNLITPVSNEELIICEKIKSYGQPFPKNKLDEREAELARLLVKRGILNRSIFEDKIVFDYNFEKDIGEIL